MKAHRAGKPTMIRASDGLDYEDLTARLLDKPLGNMRNKRIIALRAPPNDPRVASLWVEVFDTEYNALVQASGHASALGTATVAADNAVQVFHRHLDSPNLTSTPRYHAHPYAKAILGRIGTP